LEGTAVQDDNLMVFCEGEQELRESLHRAFHVPFVVPSHLVGFGDADGGG